MKPYVKRRVSEIMSKEKPMLFSIKRYLSDLDSMIQTEYVAQLDGVGGGEAMVRMLVDLALIQKEQ